METVRMTPEEETAFLRRRRGRNIGLIVVLIALVVIFYLITVAKITSTLG
jgi:hypothetical protein